MNLFVVLSDYRVDNEVCSFHRTEESAQKEVDIINARFKNLDLENFAHYKAIKFKFKETKVFDTDWI